MEGFGFSLDYVGTLVYMKRFIAFVGVSFAHQRVDDMRKVNRFCTKM